jgi:hypothetical protein
MTWIVTLGRAHIANARQVKLLVETPADAARGRAVHRLDHADRGSAVTDFVA